MAHTVHAARGQSLQQCGRVSLEAIAQELKSAGAHERARQLVGTKRCAISVLLLVSAMVLELVLTLVTILVLVMALILLL